MLLRMFIAGRLTRAPAHRRIDARPDVTRRDCDQGEVLEAARPRREPERDAGLLVRAPAAVAPEREARRRRRRHLQETARAADQDARAEPRQAGHAGPRGARPEPRGSRAAGT